jgi:hypothetical protein
MKNLRTGDISFSFSSFPLGGVNLKAYDHSPSFSCFSLTLSFTQQIFTEPYNIPLVNRDVRDCMVYIFQCKQKFLHKNIRWWEALEEH